CDAKTCMSGERKLADDGCNACKCNASGAWVCTSGAACPGGDGGAPGVDMGGSGAAVGMTSGGGSPAMTSGGSSSGITGTGTDTPIVGQCPGPVVLPPDPPSSSDTKQPCDIY